MTTDRSLDELIRDGIDAGHDDNQIVTDLIARRDFKQITFGLVCWRVATSRRHVTRHIEEDVDVLLDAADSELDRVNARHQLVHSTFALPDGDLVAWLDATVEQHEARAGWLDNHAASLLVTAQRHRTAAKDIVEAGVSCLRDLEADAA